MFEKTLSVKTVFTGRLLDLEVQEVELENGTRANREIVRHGGAVAVLARLRDGRFVFVRQFRKPVEREMLEVVAGTLEEGEPPEQCAARELKEESGYDAALLRHIGYIHPSPGYVDERIDLFYAEVNGEAGDCCPDADEHVEVVLLSRGQVLDLMRAGGINDSKTLATWLQYEAVVADGLKAL